MVKPKAIDLELEEKSSESESEYEVCESCNHECDVEDVYSVEDHIICKRCLKKLCK